MSAGESAVLRSSKPHVGKENAMLPPLTSPSRVLSLSRGQKFASPKTGHVRRPNSEDDSKIHRATSPVQNSSPEKMPPNQQRRVQQLEKSILFMREHHEKIVSALHEEIEELKRKNKELNYRLVMSPASLPAHLLSPEEDQPPASSPRHQATRATAPAAVANPVKLELLEGELNELRDTLRAERERSQRLAAHLKQAESKRSVPSTPAPSPGEVTALEQRLATAENTIRQLKKERDDCQREIQRMRGSVQFRPPWRGGGQQVRPPPPPQTGRSSTKTGAGATQQQPQQQQQLPRLPTANGSSGTRQDAARSGTAPGRSLDSRASSQGSLPALPRGRARQSQPPPPPPRHNKQQ